MFANALYPTISKPTRVTKQTATLIENIITNIHEYSIKSGILYNDISDHFLIFTFYELGVKRENEYKFFYKHLTSSANISKLKTQLQTSNWEEVYKDQTGRRCTRIKLGGGVQGSNWEEVYKDQTGRRCTRIKLVGGVQGSNWEEVYKDQTGRRCTRIKLGGGVQGSNW